MKTSIIREAGFEEALLGISLSYNSGGDMKVVADKLVKRGGSHSKFLESIAVWLDITAPRYWWSHADTYRVGVTKQSESTMHTIMRRHLVKDDFEGRQVLNPHLKSINMSIDRGDFDSVKAYLPESFLQRRIVCTNYMTLQRIIRQRRTHELIEWHQFCDDVLAQCKHPEFLQEAE